MKRTPLRRRTPLRKRSRKYRAKQAAAFGVQASLCRGTACCMCARAWPAIGISEPHHEPPRSCGGLDADTVPLCTQHHRQRHDQGARQFWGAVNWRSFRDRMRELAGEFAPAKDCNA